MRKKIQVCVSETVPYNNEEAFRSFVEELKEKPLLVEFGTIDREKFSSPEILKRYKEVDPQRVCGELKNIHLDEETHSIVADFILKGPFGKKAEALIEKGLARFAVKSLIKQQGDKPEVVLLGYNLISK